MPETITRDELKERIDTGEPLFLVEVLRPQRFEEGHLPGAINIPLDRVEELAAQLLPDKDADVVTYCSSAECQSSAKAAERLTELGYRRVREYVEGKRDWTEAGLPMEGVPMVAR